MQLHIRMPDQMARHLNQAVPVSRRISMITRKKAKTPLWFKNISVLLVFLIFGLCPVFAHAFDVFLGAGEAGAFSHFTGRQISRLINRHAENLSCTTLPGSDDMHNLTNLQEGSLDMALVDSRMLDNAVNKTGNFKFLDTQYDNLRVLASLYDNPVSLVVRKDANISSLNDLKGKRLNAGAPGTPEHLAVNAIMAAQNWTGKDFTLMAEISSSQSQDTMAFCHNTIQAMVHIGVHPDPALLQLSRLCNAELVSINDGEIKKQVNSDPAFSKIIIPANTYPLQQEAITTFGTRTILVASKDLDQETVYSIISTLYKNQKRLKSAHPALSSIRLDATPKNMGNLKLHAGAIRFFSEH